jgi:leucyl-tRNA synthetase
MRYNMKKYDPKKIEKKWQQYWEEHGTFVSSNDSSKPKKYVLVEFPYPSGVGLHMGHLRPYVAGDVYSRYARMKGFETMFPMGWDAFGLPAENFAIKNGVHPTVTTAQNIKNAKRQLSSWGVSFDWSREVNTTDPDYYKWTQWIFLQFFNAGLAYEATGLINWCPKDKTGLANEEVIDGKCERCGTIVEKKELRQWYLKITAYAEKLLEGLKHLPEWPEPVKLMQENWIGKSVGAEIDFLIAGHVDKKIKVFTTRPDTIYGATYAVLAPEHVLIQELALQITNINEVNQYIEDAKSKEETERVAEGKEKTGVELRGVKAINPATKEEIPVWVADYVLGNYGTGAIMAVPAHDERDYAFAKKYNLSFIQVIKPNPVIKNPLESSVVSAGAYGHHEVQLEFDSWTGDGVLINSGHFTGKDSDNVRTEMAKEFGIPTTKYKLRDWVFSRQRYWGEPIPIIHCEKCGIVAVPEKDLPVVLPQVEKYEPTGTGESPLADIAEWVNVQCPTCGGDAKRETNTMPQWAGSSWYFLRYPDPKNDKAFASPESLKQWMPVDLYFGGMEHTTLHLLYSRFWNLFMHDQGLVPVSEPYTKRITHGIVLGPDGEKMSKSRGNVVNPDDVVAKYGADCLRMYELFLGPHGQMVAWNDQGIVGIARFLDRVWNWVQEKNEGEESETVQRAMHKLIKKVGEDIESFSFNTAISSLMEFHKTQSSKTLEAKQNFLRLLYPFAPHFVEELSELLGGQESVQFAAWPEFNEKLIVDQEVNIVIQVNGKVRDKLIVPSGSSEEQVKVLALAQEKIKTALGGSEIKKIIFVQDKLLNIVV